MKFPWPVCAGAEGGLSCGELTPSPSAHLSLTTLGQSPPGSAVLLHPPLFSRTKGADVGLPVVLLLALKMVPRFCVVPQLDFSLLAPCCLLLPLAIAEAVR